MQKDLNSNLQKYILYISPSKWLPKLRLRRRPKYIFEFGYYDSFSDLIPDSSRDIVLGGGYWSRYKSESILTLYGRSPDYGYPSNLVSLSEGIEASHRLSQDYWKGFKVYHTNKDLLANADLATFTYLLRL